MAFREAGVHEIRVLRLWLRGGSLRSVERLSGLDRKTVRYPEIGITGIMPRP